MQNVPSESSFSIVHTFRQSSVYFVLVLVLHLLGALFLVLASSKAPLLLGLGLTAYGFGMRHAWDADHIAVIDNTTRKLLELGRKPHGVGFFFSIGHSSVVFLLSIAAGFLGQKLLGHNSAIAAFGGWVGPLVAGVYLLLVSFFNLRFCVANLKNIQGHAHSHSHMNGGLLSRLLGPLLKLVTKAWHVVGLGFLMGLGFDTASEVALLALSAGAAQQGISWFGILSLPLLFAAGMTLLDTLDGVFMTHAYGWAQVDARAKQRYNLMVTGLSGALALVIGSVSLLQWFSAHFVRLTLVDGIDLSSLGFWLAGSCLVLFCLANTFYTQRNKALKASPE